MQSILKYLLYYYIYNPMDSVYSLLETPILIYINIMEIRSQISFLGVYMVLVLRFYVYHINQYTVAILLLSWYIPICL